VEDRLKRAPLSPGCWSGNPPRRCRREAKQSNAPSLPVADIGKLESCRFRSLRSLQGTRLAMRGASATSESLGDIGIGIWRSLNAEIPLRTLIVVVLVVFGGIACSDQAAQTATPTPVVTDSSGVRLVSLGGPIRGYAQPRLDLELDFEVGNDDSDLYLFRVSGGRFLASGGFAIANAGTPELLVVGPDGTLEARIGRDGEGPGEFRTITSLHSPSGEEILAFDDRLGRLSVFEESGHTAATIRVTNPNPISDLIPLGATKQGDLVAVYGDNRVFGGDGERQDSTPLLRFSPESIDPDTLSIWPTKTWRFLAVGAGVSRTQVPFSPDLLSTGRGQRVALATTHDPRISVLNLEGILELVLTWNPEVQEVTARDFEEWQAARLGVYPDAIPEETRQRLVNVDPYPTHPVLDGIFLDFEGGVWFAPSSLSSESDRTWIRIGPDGGASGAITLPSSSKILDEWNGKIAVLNRDDMDVETVSVFHLEGAPWAAHSNVP